MCLYTHTPEYNLLSLHNVSCMCVLRADWVSPAWVFSGLTGCYLHMCSQGWLTVTCMCVFSANHLALDNPLICSSLGKATSRSQTDFTLYMAGFGLSMVSSAGKRWATLHLASLKSWQESFPCFQWRLAFRRFIWNCPHGLTHSQEYESLITNN